MSATRYVFVTDNDSHHYVIPAHRETEWDTWCEISEKDPDDSRGWQAPSWAKEVGGSPTLVTFTDPVIA